MTEIMNCLPEVARRHFIDLRNMRLESERIKYETRMRQFRAEIAAKNMGRSGWQEVQEWKFKEEMSDSLAQGFVQDAFETCKLYDIPLTKPLSDCILKATEDLLVMQYRHALQATAQGSTDVKMPLVVRQQCDMRTRKMMTKMRVLVETARVEDVKKRLAMAKESEKVGDTYTQNIVQHGGVMNASQTGNVSAQQVTEGDLDSLRTAFAEMRAFFKQQGESLDADEYVGLLAGAEKAAAAKDENKMLGYLKQVPERAWEIGKTVVPQVLLHYLKLHGMA